MSSTANWLGEWPEHRFQVWQYRVGHCQLHVRGIPAADPGGPCVELLFKPVVRLALSTMSWHGLRLALRRTTPEGVGVFFLVSTGADSHGNGSGFGVVRAGSLHCAEAGLTYSDSLLDWEESTIAWRRLGP